MKTMKRDQTVSPGFALLCFLAEIPIWFLASFGISDTAINSILFRIRGTVPMEKLPGTIICGATLPVLLLSMSYIRASSVSLKTLVVLVIAQSLGAWGGAGFVSHLPAERIRKIMAACMLATAGLLVVKNVILKPEGGNAADLTFIQLLTATVVTFCLGALCMVGFSNSSTSIAMFLLMGLQPLAIYPIVMTANAFGCLVGIVRFIREKAYHPRIVLLEAAGGVIGVLLAMRVVTSLDMGFLQAAMIVVLAISAAAMLRPMKLP